MIEQGLYIKNNIYYARRKKINTRLFWGMLWIGSTILFACIQLSFGTDEKIVAMAFLSLLLCAIPLFLVGIGDICAMFILVLLSKYSIFPFWIKTMIGQRIDFGLTSPNITFEMALVGSVVGCIALLLVNIIPLKSRLLNYQLSNKQLLLAGYLATSIGLLFLTLHIIFTPVILPGGKYIEGFGGFGSLVGPLFFGIGCISAVCLKPRTNPIHKVFLFLVLIFLIILSLQTNAKVEFSLAILTLALTIFYFRIKIKARYFIYSCLLFLFYFLVFAPIIHLTRTYAFKTADFSGKISIINNMLRDRSILEIAGQSNEIFYSNYYPTIHTFVVDRLEMIQDMDIVAGGISRRNTIEWLPFQWAMESALPSFIFPNKPDISDIDLIAYNAGYFPILTRLNHTIGIFGGAYAMFLWPGLVFISLVILFLYLLELKLVLKSRLDSNIFGIFILARYVFYFSEQSVQALIVTMMRSIPIDVILIIAILFFSKRFLPFQSNIRNTN